MPLISVIIPVFNRTWELRRALDCLVAQTFQEFEVIVCDDGSSVDISAITDLYQQTLSIKLIRISNSGGAAIPRNKGAELSSGEWIAFLDSDDWWDCSRLEKVVPYLTPRVDLIHHPLRVVKSPALKKSREKRKFIGSPFIYDPLKHMAILGNPIACSSVLLRRDKYLELGGMSSEVAMEDFDCWLRFAENDAHFYFLNQVLGNYWVGDDAISTISQKQIDGQKTLFERHYHFFKEEYLPQAYARQHFVLGMLYWHLGGHIKQSHKHLRIAYPLPTWGLKSKRAVALIITSLLVLVRGLIFSKEGEAR